jgi:hypothetical protein
MNYGSSLAPDPRQVKTGQGHAAGPANGRYAIVLSANSARRAAQLPCSALARNPDRFASGIATLPSLPRCRHRRGRLVAATYSVLGPAGRARYSAAADERGRAGHACWSA